ncbi:MAG: hypothetical protein ACRD6R_03995 [Candidatus Polarisedimenticolia bacterium]
MPDTTWRKSAGRFGAMILLTDNPEEFLEQWNRPAAPGYKPQLRTTTATRRGGNVAAIIMFRGCKPDANGNCDAEVDFRLLRPDKTLYGEQKQAELWKGKPAPPGDYLQVGLGIFGIRVEPDDPFGTYTFEATVRDRLAKMQVVLTTELRVEAGGD